MVNKTAFGIPAPTRFRTEDGTHLRMRATRKYDEKIATQLCREIMLGKSLRDVCKDPRMPSKVTVVRWLSNPRMADFREMYYYARRVQAEILIDEIVEIADERSQDWKPKYNKKGEVVGVQPDNEAIQRSRVRIDTRKWIAAKMIPRMYGEKVEHGFDVTGDLAELLKKASNQDNDLPPPIEGEKGDG